MSTSSSKDSLSKDKVIIFDTTLRDGEQALNASLSVHENFKLHYRLNV